MAYPKPKRKRKKLVKRNTKEEKKNTYAQTTMRVVWAVSSCRFSASFPLPAAPTHQLSSLRAVAHSGGVWYHGRHRPGLGLMLGRDHPQSQGKKRKRKTYGAGDFDVSRTPVPASLRVHLVLCRPHGPRLAVPSPSPSPSWSLWSSPSLSHYTPQAVIHSGRSGCCCGGAASVVSAPFVVRRRAPCIQYATRDPPHEQLLVRLECVVCRFGWCLDLACVPGFPPRVPDPSQHPHTPF